MSDVKKMSEEELFTHSFTSTQKAVNLLRSTFRKLEEDGFTQAKLARITGKNKAHINRILRGKIDGVHIGTVEVLLRAMGHRLALEAECLAELKTEKRDNWRPQDGLAEIVLDTNGWKPTAQATTSSSKFLCAAE